MSTENYSNISLEGLKTKNELTEYQKSIIRRIIHEKRLEKEKEWNTLAPSLPAKLFYHVGSIDYKFWLFRLEELEALGEMIIGDDVKVINRKFIQDKEKKCPCYSPFLFANDHTDEQSKAITSRSVMTRGSYECFARAFSLEDLQKQLLAYDRNLLSSFLDDETIYFDVVTFGSSTTSERKEEIRRMFSFLAPKAQPNYKNPKHKVTLFIEYFPFNYVTDSSLHNQVDSLPPLCFYFCRSIYEQPVPFHSKYDLRKRPYIGPTSCDAQLAILMANMAKVQKSTTVFDPFVGTGSIIVAAACLGAHVTGQDLDWKVIHGRMKGKQATIFDNFAHYNLPAPELVCSDNATPAWRTMVNTSIDKSILQEEVTKPIVDVENPLPYGVYPPKTTIDPRMKIVKTVNGVPLDSELAAQQAEILVTQKYENQMKKLEWFTKYTERLENQGEGEVKGFLTTEKDVNVINDSSLAARPMWDVILTDPPYGIRAGARRLGSKNPTKEHILLCAQHATRPYVPMTKPYPVEEVFLDFLHSAAKTLKMGGRLSYLLPTNRDFKEDELPTHPCLTCIYNCNQPLQSSFTRRAITMEKIKEYDVIADEAWIATQRELPPPRWAQLSPLPTNKNEENK